MLEAGYTQLCPVPGDLRVLQSIGKGAAVAIKPICLALTSAGGVEVMIIDNAGDLGAFDLVTMDGIKLVWSEAVTNTEDPFHHRIALRNDRKPAATLERGDSIRALDLPTHAHNALWYRKAGPICTIGQLCALTDDALHCIPGLGVVGIRAVLEKMRLYGLALARLE